MSRQKYRIHEKLLAELQRLEGEGVRWEIEPPTRGTHQKIYVNGRLACIYPLVWNDRGAGGIQNMLACVRRAARGVYAR